MLGDGKWFKASEFACRDADRTPYPEEWADRWALIRDLCDAIRDLWGGPLIVVSGYRTPDYNADLIMMDAGKGSHQVASSSQHIEGLAADLRTRNGPSDVPQLLRVVLTAYEDGKLPTLGGVGDYPQSDWIHIDCHRVPHGLRRWHGV